MKEIHFTEIDSTNLYLKKHYAELDDLDIVDAKHQSAGRGRMARVWEDSSGENLLFSVLIKDKNLFSEFSSISLLAASSIMGTLKSLGITGVSIKWPNDVMVNDKKICGILLESVSFGPEIKALIVGIGLNVNQNEFDELPHATSIYIEAKKAYEIGTLSELVYTNLRNDILMFKMGDKSYLEKIRNANYLILQPVEFVFNGEKLNGYVKGIDDDNKLIVNVKDKELHLSSGEVTFHNNYETRYTS